MFHLRKAVYIEWRLIVYYMRINIYFFNYENLAMIKRAKNLLGLCRILKERGNWLLIRHSRKQLWEIIICQNGLNKKSVLSTISYWFFILKGLDFLVWRLETFEFLFLPKTDKETRKKLNRYIAKIWPKKKEKKLITFSH